MMASLLQAHGIADGATGSTTSSGVSDDVQFTSGQTTGGSGAPLQANLQSLLSILSDRGVTSAAGDTTGASSTHASTGTTTASADTAASSGPTAQTAPPPWDAGWFNAGASTEAATTGWSDPFGQQNGMTPNQQFAQAASAYAVTSNTSNTRSLTDVTA